MDHGVTVWAYGQQVPRRIDGVSGADGTNRNDMVDMNETLSERAVARLEVEPTCFAAQAVMSDACCPRRCAPLEGVD